MASPVAHTLAGAIIYLASRRNRGTNLHELAWIVVAANLADLDLVPSLLMGDDDLFHRTFSHSFSASLLFAAIVLVVCRDRPDSARFTLLMSTAYLSQLLIDWLSLDPGPESGIPLWWPWSHELYMSNPTLFLNIERDYLWTAPVIIHNLKAVALESLILGPPAVLLWWCWTTAKRRG